MLQKDDYIVDIVNLIGNFDLRGNYSLPKLFFIMLIKNNELRIFEPSTPDHFGVIRILFKEYYNFLYSLPNMNLHIDIQKPDAEITELETGKYAPPTGALLLATYKNEFTGVVALRQLTEGICEMKRLYVRQKVRGTSIGYHLAVKIIQKGRELGYQRMRLDTHPAMAKAHTLYYELGFHDIPRYNQNIVPNALFMELNLKG